MKPDLHSVDAEPQFQDRDYAFEADPVGDISPNPPSSELDRIRDSAFSEPHLVSAPAQSDFATYMAANRARSTPSTALLCAAVAGVLAGPVAILSAFVGGNPGITGAFYVVIAGPIVEEIAKQSGLFYLLEKKPYLLTRGWQFPLCAALTALIFATIENLLYLNVYAAGMRPSSKVSLAVFRWTVCVAMHLGCALIASQGLAKVWRETIMRDKPASFAAAANYIGLAAVVHGLYNTWALLIGKQLFD